jgi:hypothetical protein
VNDPLQKRPTLALVAALAFVACALLFAELLR